jgi:hypothetical protein
MKIHFNSIKQDGDNYIYEYHTKKNENFKSTFGYLAIAGIIGSFRVVSEKGWLYLLPFWILVFILSKVLDWFIKKWVIQSKSVKVRFISKYPHYVMEDILWMLKCTNQNFQLGEIISSASDYWGNEIDIEIGIISAMKTNKANFSREILNKAVDQQEELEEKWSSRSGLKYPDLRMPKR